MPVLRRAGIQSVALILKDGTWLACGSQAGTEIAGQPTFAAIHSTSLAGFDEGEFKIPAGLQGAKQLGLHAIIPYHGFLV
jgi:hypothetical protein